jgi:hypothetical protein
MTTIIEADAFRRGFVTRFQALSSQEKRAGVAGELGQGAAAVAPMAKNLFSKAVPFAKNLFTRGTPAVAGAAAPAAGMTEAAFAKGWQNAGIGASPRAPGLLARGMGAMQAHPVATGLAAGGAATGAGALGVGNYYNSQAQNMRSQLPQVAENFMKSQQPWQGFGGGIMGKIMMFIQYLFGGGRDLMNRFSQYAAHAPGLTSLNQSQFAKPLPTAQ